MMMQNLLIGPGTEGLRKDKKPWATPEDSYTHMLNAYFFRGRTVKRSGYILLGNLANGTPVMGLRTYENYGLGLQTLVAFDTTLAYEFNGTAFVPLPTVMPVIWSGTDSQFFFTTNYANAFWATNNKPGLNGFVVTIVTAGIGITTITTALPNGFTTGQTVTFINLGGITNLNGLSFIIDVINPTTFTIPIVATGGFTTGGLALNSEVTVPGQDGIRYYGILTDGTGWANYNPPIDPLNALAGALLIFPYRGYLVFLNTWEGNDADVFNYGNRARWTQIGTPYYSEPVPVLPNPQTVDINAARDDLFGRGGANDAPTSEVIIGAAFIRDILIVYFERSAWRLRFVNNAQNPFVWERINIELGASCTFSTIPFDKGLMAISNRGIVISDGNDTIRFDEKIPDDIFNIRQAQEGLQRVYGIRSFRTKLNFWTFPAAENPTSIYPNYVLVYNYDAKTWSYFDDCFTCFGYYYQASTGYTWGELTDSWASYTNISWDSGVSQGGYEDIVAGNQQGFVFLLEQTNGQNDPSLNISAIAGTTFTSTNNNLNNGDWITLSGITGTTSDDGVSLNGRNFKFVNTSDPINASNFMLTEFKPIDGGPATGANYLYTIAYQNIIPGSVQVNVGTLVFSDATTLNGTLFAPVGGAGTINYETGLLNLHFVPPLVGSTEVYIRLVTLDPSQGFSSLVTTVGAYTGGGQIAKISNIDIQTKFFNFFKDNQRARLSRIDFYMDSTTNGQFTCNVFADSSNTVVNTPLTDNPFSNIVLTSINPYQIGEGDETIFRLFCDTLAQTIQLQFTYSDYQMAVNAITQSDIEILSLMIGLRKGGRVV